MPVDFDNHVPSLQASVVRRTARLHIFYNGAMNVLGICI